MAISHEAMRNNIADTSSSSDSKLMGSHNLSCDAHQVHMRENLFHHCLSTHDIEEIEKDLDFYEKVSLVFLLYDSDVIALQRLKMAYLSAHSGPNIYYRLLVDWVLHEPSNKWQTKFLEALCIIKNDNWIKKLGLSVEETKLRFLPLNPYTSLNVDLMRKALFVICESLSSQELECLQNLVEDDMLNHGLYIYRYNLELMEINILHWMSQKYLNIGTQKASCVNMKNLVKHLKVMEKYSLIDLLESVCKGYKSETFDDTSISDRVSVSSSQTGVSQHSVVSQIQEEREPKTMPKMYNIDPNNVGVCVIINQKTFYKDTDPKLKHLVFKDGLEVRIGTDVDRDRLSEIFVSFGFYVKIWENLTHIEMVQAIRESTTSILKKEHSCFVLCILSHGRKNAVYGVNSIAVDMDEIQKLLQGKFCPVLLQKPKIIIVQACQGLVKQNAIVSDIGTDGAEPSQTCPEVSDTVVFWATVPGYAAFRDKIRGSWFINALWEEMLKGCNDDVLSMFVNVNAKVCNKRAPIDGELKVMTPLFMTSFRKKLIFPLHREAQKAAAKRMYDRYLFDLLLDEYIDDYLLNVWNK